MADEDTSKTTISELDHSVIMYMVVADKTLGVQVARKALTYTRYESALFQLNNISQTVMMHALSCIFVLFYSLNSPIVLNEVVLRLVNKYKVLIPVHHASILTMLNVDKKVKDKRNVYLVCQYD